MFDQIKNIDESIYNIRRMHSSDLEKVMEVDKYCFSKPWNEKMWLEELKNNLTYYLVVFSGTDLVAFAGMWTIVGEAQIVRVAVKKELQGRGLGKIVTSKLVQRAFETNCFAVTLEVKTKNLSAQSVYKFLGFKTEGMRKNYYTDTHEDAFIMWRRFTEEELNQI